MAKFFLVLLICILTVYGPLELSRLIFECMKAYTPNTKFIFEFCMMWVLYGLAIYLMAKTVHIKD